MNTFIIPTTFLASLILMMLPMPDWTIWMRPTWVLMVLIYWNMFLPHRVNLTTAWVMGIILDLINGTLLGEHALAMVIVSFLVLRMDSQLRMFHLVQQGITVFVLVLIYQFILYCVQGFLGELPRGWLFWSPAVTSMLLCPWVFSILRNCRLQYRLA